jgi:hypothetical protein
VAAGGNCAAAMQGGEQPEAEVRSQTGLSRPVNSIRCLRRASLLATERSLPRPRRTTPGREPVDAGACLRRYSWSENVRKGSGMTIRDRRERLRSAGVRAPIIAVKPGNAGGAMPLNGVVLISSVITSSAVTAGRGRNRATSLNKASAN